jgi:hypothetical protein
MLDWMKIRLKSEEMEQILSHAVDDPSDVDIKDIKRVFVLMNQKQELAPIFKYFANIPQTEKINKQKMSLDGFKTFLKSIQKEEFDETLCINFFSQIRADNIFKFSNKLPL